jgi:hypothetical protein
LCAFLEPFEPSSGEFRRIVAVVVYEGDEGLSGLLKAAKDLGVLLQVVVSIWIFAHFWIFLGEPFLSHFRRVKSRRSLNFTHRDLTSFND